MFTSIQLKRPLYVLLIVLLNACSDSKISPDTKVKRQQGGPEAGGDSNPKSGLPSPEGGPGGTSSETGDAAAEHNNTMSPTIVIVGGTTDTFSASNGQKGKATFNFRVSDIYSAWSVAEVTGVLSTDLKIASFVMGAHAPVPEASKTTLPVSVSIFFKYVTPQRIRYKNQTFSFRFVNSLSKKEITKVVVIDGMGCKQGVSCDPSLSHDVVEGVAGHPSAIGSL